MLRDFKKGIAVYAQSLPESDPFADAGIIGSAFDLKISAADHLRPFKLRLCHVMISAYNNGYPPEWDEEVFEKIMEQAENFKEYNT